MHAWCKSFQNWSLQLCSCLLHWTQHQTKSTAEIVFNAIKPLKSLEQNNYLISNEYTEEKTSNIC